MIVGRRTFSSGILNALRLRDQTESILIGEPTGNKPNHFGYVQTFKLPESGLTVAYSIRHFTFSKTDTPSLIPEQIVELRAADLAAGVDPVLNAILQNSAPAEDAALTAWKANPHAQPALVSEFRGKASARFRKDLEFYTQEEANAVEALYGAASKQFRTDAGRDLLKKVISKYPKSNRAGCAYVYLAQMSEGDERESYLKTAIAKHGDSWYGDGVQVGAFARYLLAALYAKNGRRSDAEALYQELRRDYPGAIGHDGNPLL